MSFTGKAIYAELYPNAWPPAYFDKVPDIFRRAAVFMFADPKHGNKYYILISSEVGGMTLVNMSNGARWSNVVIPYTHDGSGECTKQSVFEGFGEKKRFFHYIGQASNVVHVSFRNEDKR